MTIIELTLTNMAHGGSAVGRHDGRAIFVAYGVPGEHVRARAVRLGIVRSQGG